MNKYITGAKKYFYISLTYFLFPLLANGQHLAAKHSLVKFVSNLQAGILIGQKGSKPALNINVINGLKFNTWFAGIGVGIDYYGSKRSIPLFVDVKRNLKKGNKTPFVFADGGYNVSWLRDSEKSYIGGRNYKPTGGMYYEAGIGYKFILKNKLAFGFSAGYSFKEQKETYGNTLIIESPVDGQPYYNPPVDSYHYKFRRVSIKFNCSF